MQATVASTYGESPANLAACTETLEGVDMAAHCEAYHTDDAAYYEQLALLDDAHQGVPRRAHRRRVQGLLRVGRGVDRGEGLIRSETA